jgi:glycosyltransferase involved in cell wall biosynthesis
MRGSIIFFSPFPPTRSGISDYSLTVAKSLSRDSDVLAIVKTREERDFLGDRGMPAKICGDLDGQSGLNVYQVGNSAVHDYIFKAALRSPGLIVMHDLFLHGLVKAATLGYGDIADYKSIMEFEGPSGRLVAERTLAGDFKPFYSAFAGGHKKLVQHALGVIVHSDWAAQFFRRENPKVPVYVVPHFCDDAIDAGDRETRIQTTRDYFGISRKSFVISHFGFVTESKQLNFLIRISLLLQEKLNLHLLIAGAGSRDLYLTERANLQRIKNKTLVDHLPEQMLNDTIFASDLVSLLRYPSSGETSGIGARCLSLGRPVVCFDYYAYSEFPRDVAIHIPLDTQNTDAAAEAILTAVTPPGGMKQREIKALCRAANEMSLSRVTESYGAIINSLQRVEVR